MKSMSAQNWGKLKCATKMDACPIKIEKIYGYVVKENKNARALDRNFGFVAGSICQSSV